MTVEPESTLSDSTQLAVERTRLAHDRTLMAWVRTSTSLISFGFSIYKFFQYLRESGQVVGAGAGAGTMIGPRGFALFMITIGVVTLVVATLEHRRDVRVLRNRYGVLVPQSLATYLAAVIGTFGLLLLLAVIFRR